MTNIRTATAPNLAGSHSTILFEKDRFESAVWIKGYDIILEQAIECPCKGKSGSSKTTCQNCLGSNWVFIDPVETKALITAINSQTKYRQWSPELTGTVNVTVRDSERFSFMDKITFKKGTSVLSEVKPLLDTGTQKFIFCSYKVANILGIYLFSTDTVKLIKLSADQYSIKSENAAVVELTGMSYPAQFNGVVSIEYEHLISYNVIDIPHDFRSTFILNSRGQNQEFNLPIQGVARRSHLVFGEATNYAGNNLIDNNSL